VNWNVNIPLCSPVGLKAPSSVHLKSLLGFATSRRTIDNAKNNGMKSNNTFGVHFVLRTSRTGEDDKFPVYARITVNGTRCEFSMKQSISKKDWNIGKGEAKPKNPELR
jgi:hypothetical protein